MRSPVLATMRLSREPSHIRVQVTPSSKVISSGLSNVLVNLVTVSHAKDAHTLDFVAKYFALIGCESFIRVSVF